jgi:MFS family permease
MARRSEIVAVYTAGLIQGLALVTFPAASIIFTSPLKYNLSSTAYGGMFVPQAIMAISAALLGAGLTRRWGLKRIYLLGLVANVAAMVLLVLSQFVMTHQALVYGILLLATASLGIGFGLTVPSLNIFAAAFFTQQVDRAVLILNALLGVGTALAPILVSIFIGLKIWWGLPVLVATLLVALLLLSLGLPLHAGSLDRAAPGQPGKTAIPTRFWVFAAFILLYGIVETTNGNWATLYMNQKLAASPALASLALTVFWALVTLGRLIFAGIEKWFPEARTYRLLPFISAAAFVLTAALPPANPYFGVLAFGLAGLGCSALMPLTISFGQQELTSMPASVAGFLIAFYQMGYGIAAFGVGPLRELVGLSLNMIFGLTTVVALAMATLAFVIVGHRGSSPLNPKP